MYRVIDLFAGIGGIRKGFQLGFENNIQCVFTSEWDKYAQKTYIANYPNEKIYGDITQISECSIPDHDILLAGFPCQAFSQAGLKKGFDDTRGTLFFDITRIFMERKPQIIFLENVKGLINHDNGNTMKTILRTLQQNGYGNVQYKALKARDFGVPQNRERIYIVAFRDNNIFFNFPEPVGLNTKVGDILEKTVDPKYTLSDRLWQGHQERKVRNKQNGKGFGFGLFNANSPYTNTLSARYYKDGSEILIEQKDNNPRKLTPLECSRLQGFDTFVFPTDVSDAQLYKQFGNSVCVKVVQAIAAEIYGTIKDS